MSSSEFQRPDLPIFELASGPWQARIFDPRADSAALGARYVHGGYVAELLRDGKCLTSAPKHQWDAYNGIGLPEVFEESLGFARAEPGEEFLRIGAGRARKSGREGPQARGPLSSTLNWTIAHKSADALVMETADGAVIDSKTFSYQLRRTLKLDASGLTSETWLKVRCPWSHPLAWFAHPFFRCSSGEKIAFKLPAGTHLNGHLKLSDDGLLRLAPAGGFGAGTAVWGSREPLEIHFEKDLGGGVLKLAASYPLDKLVVYGTACAGSVEPYWSRAWHDGEEATWRVRYEIA